MTFQEFQVTKKEVINIPEMRLAAAVLTHHTFDKYAATDFTELSFITYLDGQHLIEQNVITDNYFLVLKKIEYNDTKLVNLERILYIYLKENNLLERKNMKLVAEKWASWDGKFTIRLYRKDYNWFEITDGVDTDHLVYSEEYTDKEIRKDVMIKFNLRGI